MTEAEQSIYAEIQAERRRQVELYPDSEDLPDGTGLAGRKTVEIQARNACERATREGRLTHSHVFDEESAEVLAATEEDGLRKELVQSAAVCVKWIASIDRRRARSAEAETIARLEARVKNQDAILNQARVRAIAAPTCERRACVYLRVP